MDKKGIISFDLDMTLLNHKDWEIPDSAMQAVEALRKNYYIVIASGRDMDSKYSRKYRDLVDPDAIIHMNGTRVTIGEQVVFKHYMETDLLSRLLDFAERKPFSVGLTIEKEDYYVNPEYIVKHDIMYWKESDRNFMDPQKIIDMDVQTLVYIGDGMGAKEIEAAFPELKLPMFSNGYGADIVERTASKAEGLKRLCAHYGIALSRTVAFGDSMNDYEIVREAGIGVAMGNALEILKQEADYVTEDIAHDGIFKACLALGLIEDRG